MGQRGNGGDCAGVIAPKFYLGLTAGLRHIAPIITTEEQTALRTLADANTYYSFEHVLCDVRCAVGWCHYRRG